MTTTATQPPAAPRDQRADGVRGLAIAAVVYIHADGLVDVGRPALLPAGGFRWCVPTFVILTAFFAARPPGAGGGGRPYWPAVGRRWGRLLVPFVAWTVFYMAVRREWRPSLGWAAFAGHFNGFGWAGQYYFVILLQAAVLIPLLARCRVGIGTVVAAFAVLLLWTAAPVRWAGWPSEDERFLLPWVPYLLLGLWLSRRWSRTLRGVMPPALGWAVVAGGTVLLAVVPAVGRAAGPAFTPYQHPLVVILMPWLFLALCAAAGSAPRPISRTLALAGRYSLGIYCINPLFDGQAARRLLAATVHVAPHIAPAAAPLAAVVCPLVDTAAVLAASLLAAVAVDRCRLSWLVR